MVRFSIGLLIRERARCSVLARSDEVPMLDTLAPHGASVFVALADTPASRKLHYQLRYQVYCRKLAYEDPARFPDGEEHDQYDEHAVHFLAFDRRRGDWVGTLRLVHPGPAGLPLASVAGLSSSIGQLINRERVLEISRMCIHTPGVSGGAQDSYESIDAAFRAAPLVFFALVRASVAYAFQAGMSHLAFLTAPSLLRLLRRLGIHQVPAGDACVHRGLRYPRVLDVAGEFRHLIEKLHHHPLSPHIPIEPYQLYSSLMSEMSSRAVRFAVG